MRSVTDLKIFAYEPLRKTKPPRWGRRSSREGIVLVLVLVTVGMLSLGAYSYSEVMLSEYRALRAGSDEIRIRSAAESGVAALAGQLQKRTNGVSQSLQQNGWQIGWSDAIGDAYSASIRQGAPATSLWANTGPLDESAKWNINGLELGEDFVLDSRARLMALPGMTLVAADSLLDWIDADDEPREHGAESNWYLSKGLPYGPRQGPFCSIEELLLVRGIRSDLLLGEDANANGWLDFAEDDGKTMQPPDNSDHELDAGWSRWLSVQAAESNFNQQGMRKINLNDDDLVRLFHAIENAFDTQAARFVVALRMSGPLDDDDVLPFDSAEAIARRRASAEARAIRQSTDSGELGAVRTEDINGFAVDRAAAYPIRSLIDLLGRQTEAFINDEETIIESPWSNESQRMDANLAMLSDRLTTSDSNQLVGRININLAPREVLMTIPGITRDLARVIVRRRRTPSNTANYGIGWLHQSGLLDFKTLRRIAPYITSQGDVFSGVSVGKVAGVRQIAVANFLIDATHPRPIVRKQTTHITTRKRTRAEAEHLREANE